MHPSDVPSTRMQHFAARAWLLIGMLSVVSCIPGCKPKANAPTVVENDPAVTRKEEAADSPTPETAAENKPIVEESTPATEENNAAAKAMVSNDTPPGFELSSKDWSSVRLLVLGNGAPAMLQVRLQVGTLPLDAGLKQTVEHIKHQLKVPLDKTTTWSQLLEDSLIKSKLLGNLVPTAEQTDQFLSLYDRNSDRLVDDSEFTAFVTRGLSRMPHVRLGQSPGEGPTRLKGFWGPLDANNDGELDRDELAQVKERLLRLDFDGNQAVTLAESQEIETMDTAVMDSMGDTSFRQVIEIDKPSAAVAAMLEHYAFDESIGRDELFRISESQWSVLDQDRNGRLNRTELTAFLDQDAASVISIRLPDTVTIPTVTIPTVDASPPSPSNTMTVGMVSAKPTDQAMLIRGVGNWISGGNQGGKFDLPGCILTVIVRDDEGIDARRAFQQRIESVLNSEQLVTAFARTLDVTEDSVDLIKASAKPAMQAWSWLFATRHWHTNLKWKVNESPWFELVDANGDRRISPHEAEQFSKSAATWDKNQDGGLTRDEVPTSILLVVERSDRRMAFLTAGGPTDEKRGANDSTAPTWFTAMDYNSDGEISQTEFLGEESDFKRLDQNRDGIIDLQEISAQSSSSP